MIAAHPQAKCENSTGIHTEPAVDDPTIDLWEAIHADREDSNRPPDCNAVLLGFSNRRFFIARTDGPHFLQRGPCRKQRIRDLAPGDEVIYKGERVTVKTIAVYE